MAYIQELEQEGRLGEPNTNTIPFPAFKHDNSDTPQSASSEEIAASIESLDLNTAMDNTPKSNFQAGKVPLIMKEHLQPVKEGGKYPAPLSGTFHG